MHHGKMTAGNKVIQVSKPSHTPQAKSDKQPDDYNSPS